MRQAKATAWIDALPDNLRIGAHDIAIHKMAPPWGEKEDTLGEWDARPNVIRLAREMPSRTTAVEITLHEIFHAIFDLTGGFVNNEERTVSSASNGLTQVLRDNPGLAGWLVMMATGMQRPRRKKANV